jgi:hypothetical protein
MSIKEHALLVSLTVNKPQMTQKDVKATADAETANNAHNAGQYRKDLYPKTLVQPILTVESSARAFIERNTYMWDRSLYLLPTAKFMDFAERMGKFELEFNQSVTAFLNNWSNVMHQAQQAQGALFDANAYPDLSDLKSDFRFRVNYRPVTDAGDFRVQLQEEELSSLRQQVEASTQESMAAVLREPLERLRAVVAKLNEVTGKPMREVVDKKTGIADVRAPIFRDSVVDNITEEIGMLHAFAAILPDNILSIARQVADTTPHPQSLRDDPEKRTEVNMQTSALLAAIDNMLED